MDKLQPIIPVQPLAIVSSGSIPNAQQVSHHCHVGSVSENAVPVAASGWSCVAGRARSAVGLETRARDMCKGDCGCQHSPEHTCSWQLGVLWLLLNYSKSDESQGVHILGSTFRPSGGTLPKLMAGD